MKTLHKTKIVRCEHFNACHRLHNTSWSDEKNQEVFGKCNNPRYHGHNYDLEIHVTGYASEETGYVVDTKWLSDLTDEKILEPFDHKNLNEEVEEFKTLIPTVENISRVIYDRLVKELPSKLNLKIKLYETARNFAEYPAE